MSPLMVIRTLAGSPLSNLGNVRPYLLSVCQSEQKQVDEHARVIEQYRVETNQVRQRIHDLQSQALTLKQTKCSGECHLKKNVNLICLLVLQSTRKSNEETQKVLRISNFAQK